MGTPKPILPLLFRKNTIMRPIGTKLFREKGPLSTATSRGVSFEFAMVALSDFTVDSIGAFARCVVGLG